ncbi:MAG: FMN-binding protein [Candidatus Dormibacteria bacterium]
MRAAVAGIATVVGLVLVFSFKTPDATRPGGVVAVLPSPSPATDSGTPPPSGGASPSPSPSGAGGTYKDGTYSGQDVPNRYGDVQVKVVVSGGRIKDVQAVQLPFDRQRSAEISQQAAPLLHDEVIQAQSAQIDSLGGATYTSDSYAQSLQSALDMAH